MAASNTILQTILEEGKRERVMSFDAMTLAGMSLFGSLLAGVGAFRVGAPITVAAGDAFCILGAVVLLVSCRAFVPRSAQFTGSLAFSLNIARAIQDASRLQTAPDD